MSAAKLISSNTGNAKPIKAKRICPAGDSWPEKAPARVIPANRKVDKMDR